MTKIEAAMARIEERRKAMIESMGDGAAKDFPSYREAVGYTRGLLTAQSILADLAITEDDDD